MNISVIIPVYNGEKTIKRCIDSVLEQSIDDMEIIVVNDGSTDGTTELLNSYADKRIKILTSTNCGQGMARNKGIAIATGEYIGFVDADDTVLCDMYKTMYITAKEHNADMVQCCINDIKNGSVSIRPNVRDEFVEITDSRWYTDNYFYTMKHTNEVCNKIFKREFLVRAGLGFSDTKEIFSEDLKMNIEALPHMERVCFIEKAFYNYYISDDGHCKNATPERVLRIFELYNQALRSISDKHIRRAISSMAVVTVLQYTVPVISDCRVRKLIGGCKLKGYMLSSVLYKKTARHAALMAALILMPSRLKEKIIKKYYVFE